MFPEFPKKLSTSKIHRFFSQLTNFYEDNFPNREKIILTFNTLMSSLKPNNINLVVRGKDNWLFLGNNFANTIDKLTGKIYYHDTGDKNFNTTERYNYYIEIMNKLSTNKNKILFLIAPNKASIYPEYLPQYIVPASKPFHEELTQKLRQAGINTYYPRQDLIQAKGKYLLYYVTDTHWNNYGAFIAFINLISQFDPTYKNIIKEEDFSIIPHNSSFKGELLTIGNITFKEHNYNDDPQVLYKNTPIPWPNDIFTSRKLNPPLLKCTNPDGLIDKNFLVVGDSFTGALAPYFSLTFKNWYFIHRDEFHKISSDDLKTINADYVLYECVERAY